SSGSSCVQLFPPFNCLLWLSPADVELNNPFAGAIQMIPVWDTNAIFSPGHPLVAFDQQRFGFDVSLLPSQAGAKEALGAVSLPVIRLPLAMELQSLARKGFTLGELSLRLVGQRQIGG